VDLVARRCRDRPADLVEIPAYACAIHPSGSSWAYCGRSSKIVVRPIAADALHTNGTANGDTMQEETDTVGNGPLGGGGRVVDTGKGKYVMDIKYVSLEIAFCLPVTRYSG
jgi:WD repeat-containing protein 61